MMLRAEGLGFITRAKNVIDNRSGFKRNACLVPKFGNEVRRYMEVALVMSSPMSKAAGRPMTATAGATCIETTEASLALLQVHKSRKPISNATVHFGSSNEGSSIDLI
jgi:hypothetical protein